MKSQFVVLGVAWYGMIRIKRFSANINIYNLLLICGYQTPILIGLEQDVRLRISCSDILYFDHISVCSLFEFE